MFLEVNVNYLKFRPLIVLTLVVLLITGLTGCDEPDIAVLNYIWDSVGCADDGNNAHVNATLLRDGGVFADAVCADDPADWYVIPLLGDVEWTGALVCLADGPGLRVGIYADTGSELQLLKEGSPELMSEDGVEVFLLKWEPEDILETPGPDPLFPSGNYYIRVTYYTYYTGKHPYLLLAAFGADEFLPATNTSAPTAKPLPPGILDTGYLDKTDSEKWYSFEIESGQSGTGIIAVEPAYSRVMGIMPSGPNPPPPSFSIKANLRNADTSLITTIIVDQHKASYFDLSAFGPLNPGSYYINLALYTGSPDPQEFQFTVFNHALAPNTGTWAADNMEDSATAVAIQVGSPVSGSIFWPRDQKDYLMFNSQYYFIGDVALDCSVPDMHIICELGDSSVTASAGSFSWIPGVGSTHMYDPIPPGDIYILIGDEGRFFGPTEYTAALFPHGPPGSSASGHATWEDAVEMDAMTGVMETGIFQMKAKSEVFQLKPGVQDVYFTTLNVPAEEFLVGYYDIYGSRPDYRVYMGKLGTGGNPVWAPALAPDSKGKLTIDMNYKYLSDAGTYYMKFELLPSAPGQTRILVDNFSRVAACTADTNNDYYDAKGIYKDKDPKYGAFCPPDDIEDWYMFHAPDFNPQYGLNAHLILRGGAMGMTIRIYDNDLHFKGQANVTEVGGTATVDLKGIVQPSKYYYIKVAANPAEERIQIYELEFKSKLRLFKPEDFIFMQVDDTIGLKKWPMRKIDD